MAFYRWKRKNHSSGDIRSDGGGGSSGGSRAIR